MTKPPPDVSQKRTRARLDPVFLRGPQRQTLPIIDYHRGRWASIKSGELGIEFVNSTHAAFRVFRPLNIVSLHRSVSALTSRHSILNAHVIDMQDGPEFVFNPERDIKVAVVELANSEAASREEVARKIAAERIWKPFEGSAEPWLRVFAIRLSATEHVVGFVVHHFIADAWSVRIVLRELVLAYAAFEAGVMPTLPELPFQYCDYVTGMNDWIRGEAAKSSAAYWGEYLRNAPATIVPPDFHIEPEAVGEITTESHGLSADVVAELRSFSKSVRASMHAVVAAALVAVIAHQSKTKDVVIVSRIAGRNNPALLQLVGAFFDALALRVCVVPGMSFSTLVNEVQRNLARALLHQSYPYYLVRSSLSDIGASHIAPMLNFMDAPRTSHVMQSHLLEPFALLPPPPVKHSAGRYTGGLYTEIRIDAAGLHCRAEYLSLMYKRATVSRFNQLLCRLLEGAIHDASRSLPSLLAD